MNKWFVYGIHIGGWDLKASDPVQFHRGWPGVGFTHSLLYGVVISPPLLAAAREQDLGDQLSDRPVGARDHRHRRHGRDDAALPVDDPHPLRRVGVRGPDRARDRCGGLLQWSRRVWDAVWIVYGIFSWRVLTRSYFEQHVFTADEFWSRANKYLPMAALLVVYRAAFFYGNEPLDCVDPFGRTQFTTIRTTSRGVARTGCMRRTRRASPGCSWWGWQRSSRRSWQRPTRPGSCWPAERIRDPTPPTRSSSHHDTYLDYAGFVPIGVAWTKRASTISARS